MILREQCGIGEDSTVLSRGEQTESSVCNLFCPVQTVVASTSLSLQLCKHVGLQGYAQSATVCVSAPANQRPTVSAGLCTRRGRGRSLNADVSPTPRAPFKSHLLTQGATEVAHYLL